MRSVITGTGMYIPEASVDNHALAKIMDTSDEWIQVRTGIVKRLTISTPAQRPFSSASSGSSTCRASTSASSVRASSMPCSSPMR